MESDAIRSAMAMQEGICQNQKMILSEEILKDQVHQQYEELLLLDRTMSEEEAASALLAGKEKNYGSSTAHT